MENFVKFECDIAPTDPDAKLELEIWIDSHKIFDNCVTESQHIEHSLADDDGEHELRFVLKNKDDLKTVIDSEGNIVKDSLINIDNLKFDDIELGYTVTELSTYTHNFNNHGEQTVQKFYGTMGCNGTVTLKFTTPLYLWLLENM